MSRNIGGVSSKELSKFVKNSYAKRKDAKPIGNYVLDKELSTGKSKVYYDPTTKKSVVAHSGTHGTFQDWKQNINILQYASCVISLFTELAN